MRRALVAAALVLVAPPAASKPTASRIEIRAFRRSPGGSFGRFGRRHASACTAARSRSESATALLVFPVGDEVWLAERGPGADFGLAARLGAAGDPYAVSPAVAVRADGAAVVGWAGGIDGGLRAAVRGAPGPFGAAVAVAPPAPLGLDRPLAALFVAFAADDAAGDYSDDVFSSSIAAAASDRGDALVALSTFTLKSRARVRVARRLPGGSFGTPETLFSARAGFPFPPIVHAGLSAAGEAIVAWTVKPVKETAPFELWAAIAPFGEPKQIDPTEFGGAVRPPGRR